MRQSSAQLAAQLSIAHGFYGRSGGVSSGIYASLNCGAGSRDVPEAVQENRERVRRDLGADSLVSVHQVHSASVVTITQQQPLPSPRPEADAMVSNLRGIALGILTADCAPVLFADAQAGVIGAAHAGWKGAAGGVLENTVLAMEQLGASRKSIVAAIGPCIAQASYEVGPEFKERFSKEEQTLFFAPTPALPRKQGREHVPPPACGGRLGGGQAQALHHFNLLAYVRARLMQMGLASAEDLAIDTYSNAEHYFSYRRTTHAGEADYGRQISVIMMKESTQ